MRDSLRYLVELVTDLVFTDDGTATAKGASDSELDVPVGWHFGFYSRPKDGARGVVVKADGQGNTAILVGYRDKQYEMSLSKGEVGLKNAFDASILLNKDGDIIQTSKSGRTVQVNGSDYALPKWDDFYTDFAVYLGVLHTVLGTLVPVTGATGTAAYATATALANSLIIKIATPTNYKSSKAKNG